MFDPSAATASFKDAWVAALESPSGLDDVGRVDTIRALEELACVVSAAQAALAAELDESQRADQAAAGEPAARQGRGVAAQVALARRESPHRGQRHLTLARIVRAELPCTWGAWRTGRITEWKATLIARETACLSREDRATVDAVVAGDPARLEGMGVRELAQACSALASRLDPAGCTARRRKAESERSVSLRPAPDTMTWLTALLPVKDGVAAYAALTRAADSARAGGDERTKGQVMADTLVDAVLGEAARRDDAVTRWNLPSEPEERSRRRAGVELGLVMTDTALFGTSEDAAHLEGFGPIPAELGREILAGACSDDELVWLRRLYACPESGQLLTMDRRTRLFRGSLARFIRLRDQICRTPWCDAPIRHADHADSYDGDGPTSADNGQGLCEACNHAKQALGWRSQPSPSGIGHRIGTRTPTGHVYGTSPPAVATIRTTPIRLDFVLAV